MATALATAPVPAVRPRRPAWWGEVAVVLFLLVAYDRVANLAQLRTGPAERHARSLLAVERALHVAVERPLGSVLDGHSLLSQVLSLYYDLAHGLVTCGVLLAVWLRAPAAYRACRRTLLVIALVALAVFVALPVMPPRLLPGSGVVDVVARSHTWGAWSQTASVARHADEYASLPSLHVAWAVWVVLAVAAVTGRRRWRALAVAHLVATTAVVLLTGNHYVLDVVAGALLALAAHRVTRTGALRPRRAARRARRAAGPSPAPLDARPRA